MLSKNQTIGIIIVIFILSLMIVFWVCNPQLAREVKEVKEVKEEIINPSEQEKTTLLSEPAVQAGDDYQTLVEKYARDTQNLTIGPNCQMDPLVIKFNGNATLVITNSDSLEHTISFENQNFLNVSPNGKREINIQETFGIGEGIWRYRCGDLNAEQNVGVMYLSQ
jgi:uncharacterized membrane protein YvbJ